MASASAGRAVRIKVRCPGCTRCRPEGWVSAGDGDANAVSNSRRANASSDHNVGVSAGAPGALLAANGLRKLRSRFDTTPVITRTGSTATGAAAAGARCETSIAAVGPTAAEYLATGVSPTVDVTDDESFDTASDVTVEFKGRWVAVATAVFDRELRPDRMACVAVAGGALVHPFNVVSSGVDGVRVLVGVVALIWAPPVLAAALRDLMSS